MHYQDHESGYSKQQSTRPQTLAYTLADSPAGQMAWISKKIGTGTDWQTVRHPEKQGKLDIVPITGCPTGGSAGALWEVLRGGFPLSPFHRFSFFPKRAFCVPRAPAKPRVPNLLLTQRGVAILPLEPPFQGTSAMGATRRSRAFEWLPQPAPMTRVSGSNLRQARQRPPVQHGHNKLVSP
ncbi:MAG: hypothetical protein CM15mP89_5400 [Gammaproteobacteria bacterium]|nr:MAG: hypothetical protein CM15mP89_5400 [Gammaproteobacteria bacterium]